MRSSKFDEARFGKAAATGSIVGNKRAENSEYGTSDETGCNVTVPEFQIEKQTIQE